MTATPELAPAKPDYSFLTEDQWQTIRESIAAGECVPFLGAGASLGYEGAVGLPTGGELAAELAKECKYPGPDPTDFLRVSQYYEYARAAVQVRRAISRRINVPGVEPSRVHRALATLPFSIVLTTNFDNLMERAFAEVEVAPGRRKQPQTTWYPLRGNEQQLPLVSPEAPLVYKLHGTVDRIDTMLVTEDNVVDFLTCVMLRNPPLPELVRGVFARDTILFIGYGLRDWNIRVLLRATRERYGVSAQVGTPSFAVQRPPDHEGLRQEWSVITAYWRATEGLRLVDAEAVRFAEGLRDLCNPSTLPSPPDQ